MKNFAVIFISFLATASALACSCIEEYPTAKELLKNSHSVFIGIPARNSEIVSEETQKTQFTVIRNFKNARSSTQTIFSTRDNGANCGINFEKDKGILLVTTDLSNGKPFTSSCSVYGFSHEDTELNQLIRQLAKKNI